ncbi:MAG: hypothetical protein R3Y13_00350 [bacterium]
MNDNNCNKNILHTNNIYNKNKFDMAEDAIKLKKYNLAASYYLEIMESTNLQHSSIFKLVNLYYRCGKLQECRDLLTNFECLSREDKIRKLTLLSKLENKEYNYVTSYNLANEVINKLDKNDKFALYNRALSLLNLGEYKEARVDFMKIKNYPELYEVSMIYLIKIEIILGNLRQAFNLANSIITSDLRIKQKIQYFKYYLSKELNVPFINPAEDIYSIMIDKSTDNTTLSRHIKKHFNDYTKSESLKFLNITVDELITEVEERIKEYYYSYAKCSDRYIVELQHGTTSTDNDKNHATVYVNFDTSKILTFYPISVSDQFDKEGYGRIKK